MDIRVVSFQKHKRMSVIQFLTPEQNSFNYISGPSALKNGSVKVKEVSQAGSVNDLLVFNLSENYVFFTDGDILTGAKQNRVLNTSVLLAPNSKVNLPVSCIEQGRWDNYSYDFLPSDYIVPQKLRANKARAVKENREQRKAPMSRQAEVWNDVEQYSINFECDSPTKNLNEVYEKRKEDFDSFIKNFTVNENANGLAVFSDNRLLCTDLFNRTEIYREYFPKLLRSSSMELIHLKKKENTLTEAEGIYKTILLYDSIPAIESSTHKGVGAGTEKRFENRSVTGFILEFNKHIIHLTALNIEGEEKIDFRRNGIH